MSSDGRYVAFLSGATNLVPGDTNAMEDFFVRDAVLARTTKVSVGSDGVHADGGPPGGGDTPSISSDGRYVAFASLATNLVPDDTNLASDVFVRDRLTAQTTRVSVGTGGSQLPHSSDAPAISADGRHVAFTYGTRAGLPTTTEVLVHDRQTVETGTVSVSSDGIPASGLEPAISGDGRLVVFSSFSPTLVTGDTNTAFDAFVHDRVTGRTDRISVASDGTQGSGASRRPAISDNGRYAGFSSTAPELVPGDTNGGQDVFVRDLQTGSLSRASVSSDGRQGDG